MSRSRPVRPRGFTLVELLVVIGIIAILMALLTPAVMWGINAARRARMGVEIAALNDAIEKYKSRVGDYPPNFRDYNAFIRHVRTRYPKIAPANLDAFVQLVWPGYDYFTNPPPVGTIPQIDEGESLVFWLSLTRNDPQYPFNPAGTAALQVFYEFDQRRLVDLPAQGGDDDSFPSYRAAFAKDTFYLYLDSRSYDELTTNAATDPLTGAWAEIDYTLNPPTHALVARPYATDTGTPVNPTSFQILCAGQDGDFGNADPLGNYAGQQRFPGGLNYTPAVRDNITNFSEGRTLEDHIP
jgi:prepilin-type N-terminal cleavage/methylation domain-containing protein